MAVKNSSVGSEVTQLEELIGERAVESFVHCIVFRRPWAAVVLRNIELLAGVSKLTLELRPIVVSNVLNAPVHQVVEAIEEISCMP